MATRPANELLYDSEASLRLVDNAIGEFGAEVTAASSERAPGADSAGGLLELPKTLLRAYGEITNILERLRESRGILEQAAVDRLQHMSEKLKEVSSATELAATDILNGLDHAVAMVDELDVLAEQPDGAARGREIRSQMRDDLFGLMVHLQFQDITTQQLAYASSVIVDMEQRVAQIVAVFDPQAMGLASPTPAPVSNAPVAFDPNATNTNAAERQALADELFTTKR
jgi:chemotaxis regulatin CheY-phosphate phosphatase CheZ